MWFRVGLFCLLALSYTLADPIQGRGPSNLEYKVNILTKMSSDYTFPLVIGQNEKVGLWLLSRQAVSSNTSETIALYDPRSLPREVGLTNSYACLPNEQTCNQISLSKFDNNDLGVYTFRFDSSNYLTMKTFTFNVSAYSDAISIDCSNLTENSVCSYNAKTQTLSVIADEPVQVKCSIPIYQNDKYPVSAQFNFISELYGEECMGNTDLSSASSVNSSSNFNVMKKTMSKNCTRTFTKQDLSKSYSCQLNPIVSSTDPITYQQTKTYESLDIKLDVQYGPDQTLPLDPIPFQSTSLFNKTQMVGDAAVKQKFICPFIGNPAPLYYWRVVSVATNESTKIDNKKLRLLTPSEEFSISDSQEFPVPSDLQVGSYSFECKAKVQGMVMKFSPVVKFNLEMIPPPPEPVRNQGGDVNVGAAVGGIIGGLALLTLVVIVVVAVLRIRKSNPKNEIEKAKELDLDITDHHTDLKSKANLVQEQQQQQVKQQLGNKVIAGLMPNSTAQAYASIAHAAAAAAQSNLYKNNGYTQSVDNNNSQGQFNSTTTTSMGSTNALINNNTNSQILAHNNNTAKQQSYANPGFFESASYSTQNPLESPPPYESALHQPTKKENSPTQQQQRQQQLINQQQKDYMGSSTRLISGSNTPIQQQRPIANGTSHSYTISSQVGQNMSLINSTPNHVSTSLQQLQYQQAAQALHSANQLQYASVHNMQNQARNRNPLNGPVDNSQQPQHQQQYTTIAAQLSSNPIDV